MFVYAMFAMKGLFVIAVSRLLGAVDQQEMLFLERSTHTYQAEYKAYGLGPYVQELHST